MGFTTENPLWIIDADFAAAFDYIHGTLFPLNSISGYAASQYWFTIKKLEFT